jgi:hypothetical protein
MRAAPKLAEFVEYLETNLRDNEPDDLWKCESVFRELMGSSFLVDVLNHDLVQLRDRPGYLPELTRTGVLTLLLSDLFSITARLIFPVTDARPAAIYAISENQLIGGAGQTPLVFRLFEQPNPYPIEVLDRNRPIAERETLTLYPKQVCRMSAPSDTYVLQPPKSTGALVIVSSCTKVPIRWRYNVDTLCPDEAISTDPVSSRIEYSVWALSELGNEDSISVLTSLTGHRDHFVRWGAVKALVRLSPDVAGTFLRRATSDTHPHVRSAAMRSIDAIQSAGIQL